VDCHELRSTLAKLRKNYAIQWKFVSVSLSSSLCSSNSNHKRQINFVLRLFDSEQLALLGRSGLISSTDPEDTPMAILQDIKHWLNTIRLNYRTQNAPAPPNM